MKLTSGILILGMTAAAWGQNSNVIDNTRTKVNGAQQPRIASENADLASGSANQASATNSTNASQPVNAAPRVVVTAAPKPGVSKAKTAAHRTTAPKQVLQVEDKKNAPEAPAETPKNINLTGRRDPFLSPVVNRTMVGSGCSTGKRCLAIDQINLKGIVSADNGMIAVVVNALDKAYFLRENDPVFNGYVVKITGDSIVFKETVQDKLGKPFMREVTKKITTPAV
ncbi:MAG: hypothetical protein JOY93_00785 [Acidobacteriales bacterium]|nr:hypothetical protein [Terriglobales bacterium]